MRVEKDEKNEKIRVFDITENDLQALFRTHLPINSGVKELELYFDKRANASRLHLSTPEALVNNTVSFLPNIQTLERLTLGGYLTDNEIIFLAKTLPYFDRLQTLNLSKNAIYDVGAKALATALKENRSLQKLDLNTNHFSNVDDDIADMLRSNQTLQSINLSNTRLQSVDKIVEAALESKSLQSISLPGISFHDTEQASLFALRLKQNKTLSSFNALGSKIFRSCEPILLKALEGKVNLHTFILKDASDPFQQQINAILEKNKKFGDSLEPTLREIRDKISQHSFKVGFFGVGGGTEYKGKKIPGTAAEILQEINRTLEDPKRDRESLKQCYDNIEKKADDWFRRSGWVDWRSKDTTHFVKNELLPSFQKNK